MPEKSLVLLCTCRHTEWVPAEVLEAAEKALAIAGIPVTRVDDLCGLAARHDPRLQAWAQSSQLIVLACYPRAITSLFQTAGAPLKEDGSVHIINLRTQSPETLTAALPPIDSAVAPANTIPASGHWLPWFPVLDSKRCQNCKLCLNFCLFGVYALDENDHVTVAHPDHCKTHCPACARICPAQAIIFPKSQDSPINGDVVPSSSPIEAADSNTLNTLLTGNVHDLLRQRSQPLERFSTQPRHHESLLDRLNRELDIPHTVLKSLKPEELRRIQKRVRQKRENT